MFTKVETLITRYELPESVAREVIADQTQTALRNRWQVWLWVVVAVLPAVWFFFQPHAGGRFAAFLVLLAACMIWFALGSYFATASTHIAARTKADRMAAKHL